MSQKTYYGYSTYQQRRLLFETWKETGEVRLACKKAHVGRSLFYIWKPRFEEKGYEGLEEFKSRAAHKLNKKDESIEQQVVELKRKNKDWGKRRISDEMSKANNWTPVVSPNTVRRMLETAGLWSKREDGKKKRPIKAQFE